MSEVTGDDLDRLYARPADAIQRAVLPYLVPFHEAYIGAATSFCLASGREHGLDASPRGGPAGFVKVLDPHHVAFADWPGNNRIETMRNLVEDPRLAMLFLFPGLEVFLRIKGHGRLSTDPDLLGSLKEGGEGPEDGNRRRYRSDSFPLRQSRQSSALVAAACACRPQEPAFDRSDEGRDRWRVAH